MAGRWITGMDGCRGQWIAVSLDLASGETRAERLPDLAVVLDGPLRPEVLAVDVPIGLLDRVGRGGRPAETAVRPMMGARRSSIFAVPSRAAVYASTYEEAKRLARVTSDPPFAPSIQAWNIFPYIRQVDALLRARPDLRSRVYEVHPEVAFATMGGRPVVGPKKGSGSAEGLANRRDLLRAACLPEALVAARPPVGVGRDDYLDALAGLVVAARIVEGRGRSFPDPPAVDPFGLPVAIWAFR